MKKRIFIGIILTVVSIYLYGQTEKKTFLLGGYANFNALSSFEEVIIDVNPNSGYFLSDRFCLGISIPVVYIADDFYWGVSPFARYYLKSRKPRSLFFSGSVGMISLLEIESGLTDRILSLGIGHVWFLNKSVGFETALMGSTSFEEIDVGLFVGFQIYFNRAKTVNE